MRFVRSFVFIVAIAASFAGGRVAATALEPIPQECQFSATSLHASAGDWANCNDHDCPFYPNGQTTPHLHYSGSLNVYCTPGEEEPDLCFFCVSLKLEIHWPNGVWATEDIDSMTDVKGCEYGSSHRYYRLYGPAVDFPLTHDGWRVTFNVRGGHCNNPGPVIATDTYTFLP